jgi:hypothetical protein
LCFFRKSNKICLEFCGHGGEIIVINWTSLMAVFISN